MSTSLISRAKIHADESEPLGHGDFVAVFEGRVIYYLSKVGACFAVGLLLLPGMTAK